MWFVLHGRRKYSEIVLEAVSFLLITYETFGYPQQWDNSNPKEMKSASHSRDYSVGTSDSVLGPVPICKNATFCEDVPNYPIDLVSKAIEKQPTIRNYATVEAMDTLAVHKVSPPEEEPLCLSSERIIYPKTAESINKEWLYIVNYANFTQSVRIETCVEEDSSCKVIDGFAEGYVTACKQKYIYHQLSTIAADGTLNREYFRFPASCCCHIQFVGIEI